MGDETGAALDGSTALEADPVIEAYKEGIDRSLIVENLRRAPEERLASLASMQRFVGRFRGAAWARAERQER
jgi:hypothetical protein